MLLAEITPTTMSVRIPETDYVVNSISFLEEPEVGSTLNINANIINTGDFYNDIVDSTSKCKITTSFRKSFVSAFQNSIFL